MSSRLVLFSACILLALSAPVFGQVIAPQAPTTTHEQEKIQKQGTITTKPEKDYTTPTIGMFDLDSGQLPTFVEPEFTLTALVEKDYVLLLWTEVKDVSGFNIYSKKAGMSYSKINSIPIISITDCNTIRNLISPNSPESTAIYRTLGVSPCSICYVPTNIKQSAQAVWRHYRSILATTYYKIALVMGTAYLDSSATQGTYYYMINGIKAGAESTLVTDFKVEAGKIVLLPAPTGVNADSGDSKAFVSWESVSNATGYDIYRSTSNSGPFSKLNFSLITGEYVINPITLDTIWTNDHAGKPGFFDETCVNNTTYYYKVQAIDLLGRSGKFSSIVAATPRDMTRPVAPKDIAVEPLYGAKYGLKIVWPKITKDENDWIEKVAGYDVYRYSSYEQAIQDSSGKLGKRINATLIPQPKDTIIKEIRMNELGQYVIYDVAYEPNVEFEELFPNIKPDTIYWYRVQCEDSAVPSHNKSRLSAAVFGSFKDTVPPQPPTNLNTSAYEDSIVLTWTPPTDADLAGFNIYRGICGCESIFVYRYLEDSTQTKEYKKRLTTPPSAWAFDTAYCRPYNLNLIANLDSAKAKRYVDRSLPAGSPICYRYGIKAYDKNQNLSTMSDSICDRLKDKTGPPAPVIAGLKARDRAIMVQWAAPPIQDLFGFIVQRSETGSAPWIRVNDSLRFPIAVTCADIPATNIWAADTIFSFVDTTALPKKTYWYRVLAADYNGNIGDTSVAIETFTFDFSSSPRPTNLSVVQLGNECALKITWKPQYDSTYLGFAVFRSSSKDCCYRQISPIIQDNEYIDNKVSADRTYWYEVQYFGKDGNRSLPSDPEKGIAKP